MRPLEPSFKIEYSGQIINVSEHQIADDRVFYLEFSDHRPLKLIVAERRPSNEKFWTSIPEGRQDEAKQFGKLIATFIRSKRK